MPPISRHSREAGFYWSFSLMAWLAQSAGLMRKFSPSSQTDRVLGKDRSSIPLARRAVFRLQKPASVMVWAGVLDDGMKLALLFVDMGVMINSHKYKSMLEEDIVPWLQNHYGDRPNVSMQDGAPAHTARLVKEFCPEVFPSFWSKEMWPPSSPDLNPMDFSVWSILEAKACSKPHSSITALKTALNKAWAELDEDLIHACCSQSQGQTFSCHCQPRRPLRGCLKQKIL